MKTVADRMRALQEQGLDIAPMRHSRHIPEPVLPISPRQSITPTSLPSPIMPSLPLKPSPPGSSLPSPHTLVSPSQLGPPSPSSSPTLSAQSDAFDTTEFTTFPSIEELDRIEEFSLSSAPPFLAESQESHNAEFNISPPSNPAAKPLQISNDRPHSTPVYPLENAVSSLPGSPTKSSLPLKLSSHSPSPYDKEISGKSFIPVKATATPGELSEYMREGRKILLLDVRNRIDFDKEHIRAIAVACVEPFALLRETWVPVV